MPDCLPYVYSRMHIPDQLSIREIAGRTNLSLDVRALPVRAGILQCGVRLGERRRREERAEPEMADLGGCCRQALVHARATQ